MLKFLRRLALFSLLVAAQTSAFAETVVTPFGVFDPAKNKVKLTYNVRTENGLETKSRIVASDKVSDARKLDALIREIGGVKFVVSPEDADVIEDEKTFSIMMKPDPKATAASFRTRTYLRVKSMIIVETRKYYKENIPKATLPNGAFINEGGGSMVLVDKDKRPLGTLIISYSTDFVLPSRSELEGAKFITLSQVPPTWTRLPEARHLDGWMPYQLPSGEKVCVRRFGKVLHCAGWKANAKIAYTFNRLGKRK